MTAKRSLRIAIVALIAFSAQAAYAIPARTADEFRAAHCCATHCNHSSSPATANRCCHVEQSGADVATVSASKTLQPPVAISVLFITADTDCIASPVGLALDVTLLSPLPAAPLYLLTRTLRL